MISIKNTLKRITDNKTFEGYNFYELLNSTVTLMDVKSTEDTETHSEDRWSHKNDCHYTEETGATKYFDATITARGVVRVDDDFMKECNEWEDGVVNDYIIEMFTCEHNVGDPLDSIAYVFDDEGFECPSSLELVRFKKRKIRDNLYLVEVVIRGNSESEIDEDSDEGYDGPDSDDYDLPSYLD